MERVSDEASRVVMGMTDQEIAVTGVNKIYKGGGRPGNGFAGYFLSSASWLVCQFARP